MFFIKWQGLILLLVELCIGSLYFFHPLEKGVPDFWLTAMKTNEVLADEVRGSKCQNFHVYAHYISIIIMLFFSFWCLDF